MNHKTGNGMKWSDMIRVATRLAMAGLFIYAGAIKMIHPDAFQTDIESYRIMPYSLAWLIAFYLPPLEILCGLGLIFAKTRNVSALFLASLMLVFIVAISGAWVRGLDISCGCFGASQGETNYPWLIIRDLLIITALLFCVGNIFDILNTTRNIIKQWRHSLLRHMQTSKVGDGPTSHEKS